MGTGHEQGVICVPGFASAAEGAVHFFGTKQAACLLPGEHGNRDVSATERSLRAEGSPLRAVLADCQVAAVKQVHGTDALVVEATVPPQAVLDHGWDALVTNQPQVCLTIKTADCVPILLHDPRRHVIAAIHAGWRGAVAGILPKTLTLMTQRFGCVPADVQVGIGPSAGVCCYEVDRPVLDRLQEAVADWATLVEAYDATAHRAKLHLHRLLLAQAATAGVTPAHLRTAPQCTICQPDRFYSYRREGLVRGTMISGIMMRPSPGGAPGHA